MAECITVKKNLGKTKCNKLPQLFAGMFTGPQGFKIPAATLAEGSDAVFQFLQDAMVDVDPSKRIYQWSFVGVEDAKEDAVYEENALADLFVRGGKYRWRFQVQRDLCFHKAMYTHRGGNQGAFFYDIENQLLGRENTDGDMLMLSLSLLSTEKLMISDGSTASKSPVYVVLKSYKEIDKTGVLIDADWVNDFELLTDVVLNSPVGGNLATKVKVTVKQECDGEPVIGLTAPDFVLLKTDGTAQTISSVTETGGVYSLNGTGLLAGSVHLVSPDVLSTIGKYEGAAATVTMP